MKQKKSSDANQASRFIEAARAAGASEDEAVFDAAMKKIVKAGNVAHSTAEPGSKDVLRKSKSERL